MVVVFGGGFWKWILWVFYGGGVSCSCRESGCGGVRARCGSPVAATNPLVGATGGSQVETATNQPVITLQPGRKLPDLPKSWQVFQILAILAGVLVCDLGLPV